MSKKITFQDRLMVFIEHLGLKPTSFEAEMGFSNGSIGKVLNENRAISSDRLETIFYKYPELSAEWLLTGRGKMIKSYGIIPERETLVTFEPEPATPSYFKTKKSTQKLIAIADIKAAAGIGYINSDIEKPTDFIQLPSNLIKSGTHLCVRIKGSSMSPTLQDGGFVVIRLLDNSEWQDFTTDRVYVVSDKEGMTYLKRLRNRLQNGFIVLTSDNPDKATYPNFNLQETDILSIWYVEWYLSAKLPNIHDQFYSRLERLENSIEDINRKFEDLEKIELKVKSK